jgi:hypothetical protein
MTLAKQNTSIKPDYQAIKKREVSYGQVCSNDTLTFQEPCEHQLNEVKHRQMSNSQSGMHCRWVLTPSSFKFVMAYEL